MKRLFLCLLSLVLLFNISACTGRDTDIETAYMYGNEDAVGEGVRQAMEEYGIPREDIFVITKIYPSQFDDPEAAIDMALEKLDIGYIDMMLLHHPGTGDVDAYKAMERYVEQGKIHSLGLSNWYVKELTDFLPQVNITPALVQNEIHLYYQEQDVVPFIQEKGIDNYDWLGNGIYFWENSYERAYDWAKSKYGKDARVIGAILDLGYCLNLTDYIGSKFKSLLLRC